MVFIRRSASRQVPTIADAAASTVFDEAYAQGASTKEATEATPEAARIALDNSAPPSQEPFSTTPDPDRRKATPEVTHIHPWRYPTTR